MTEIRLANVSDIPEIIRLGRIMHAESPRFSRFSWSEQDAIGMFERLIAWDQACVFIAERDGAVIGGLAGACVKHWFSQEMFAQDFAIFVDPEARGAAAGVRLIETYKDWALRRGARFPQIGLMAGIKTKESGKMLERMGWRWVGDVYEWGE